MNTARQYLRVADITASHCCICQAQLTDAESVEHGVGPICGGKYYSPLHQPTEDQVRVTLGKLAVSDLPDEVIEGFLAVVDNNNVNARLGCNLLVKWASAHYNDREEVFKCSAIIRDLGYVALAEKLEMDRTKATIIDRGTHLDVFVSGKSQLMRDFRAIPGVEPLMDPDTGFKQQTKRGHKTGWKVPVKQEAYLECVLGIHGMTLVSGTKGIRVLPRRRVYDLIQFKRPSTPTVNPDGRVILYSLPGKPVQVTAEANGLIAVSTPYLESFKEDLKKQVPYLHRQWDGMKRCWLISISYLPTMKGLIDRWFADPTGTGSPP